MYVIHIYIDLFFFIAYNVCIINIYVECGCILCVCVRPNQEGTLKGDKGREVSCTHRLPRSYNSYTHKRMNILYVCTHVHIYYTYIYIYILYIVYIYTHTYIYIQLVHAPARGRRRCGRIEMQRDNAYIQCMIHKYILSTHIYIYIYYVYIYIMNRDYVYITHTHIYIIHTHTHTRTCTRTKTPWEAAHSACLITLKPTKGT
jgi:hypothetical protein